MEGVRPSAVAPRCGALWLMVALIALLTPKPGWAQQEAQRESKLILPLSEIQVQDENIDPAPEKSAGSKVGRGQFDSARMTPTKGEALNAMAEESDVVLTWRVTPEVKYSGVRIEHRPDGDGAFAVLDIVRGVTAASGAHRVRYRVTNLPPGAYDFRLAYLDSDEVVHHSSVVEETVKLQRAFYLSPIHPSPMRDVARLKLMVRDPQMVHAVLRDAEGRKVQALHADLVAPHETVTLTPEAEQLPAGVYVVHIEGETFSATRRVTIVR